MLRLRFFSLNMENIEVKRSILFQIPYFRKLVVKKLRVLTKNVDIKMRPRHSLGENNGPTCLVEGPCPALLFNDVARFLQNSLH